MIPTKQAIDHFVAMGAEKTSVYNKVYKTVGSMPDYIDIPMFEALIERAITSGKEDLKEKAQVLKDLSRPELREYLESKGLWVEQPEKQAQANAPVSGEPIIGSKFEGHIGMVFLRNATAQAIAAMVALLFQSFMYTILLVRVFEGMNFAISSKAHWAIAMFGGVIFEASGIFVGANFNNRKINFMGEEVSARSLWLASFFTVQVMTDLCVTGVIKSPIVDEVIIGVSMPLAIMVYANLFMRENREQ